VMIIKPTQLTELSQILYRVGICIKMFGRKHPANM
jgi:hypothetical protein